jgi:hypothetical protein
MGKPKHSDDPRGEQKGAQQHDEGQYGPKALEAKRAEIADHSGARRESERAAEDPRGTGDPRGEAELHERIIANPEFNADGRHRLFENRKQHDEAEKNSEKNRRTIDVERHGHDADDFQIPGGRSSHTADMQARGDDADRGALGGGQGGGKGGERGKHSGGQ